MGKELAVRETPIPGLLVVDLVLHEDPRGWFKENYQQAKLEVLGLPHFEAIQNNFSFNKQAGVTRGLHAEPWEKYTSLANGRAFCAWVDLRQGDSFGTVFSMEISPDTAVFVPRGVANSYQTLEAGITYTYLVNAHWSPDAKYSAVSLFDPALEIDWPIPQDQALVSDKDQANPLLKDVIPMEFAG